MLKICIQKSAFLLVDAKQSVQRSTILTHQTYPVNVLKQLKMFFNKHKS